MDKKKLLSMAILGALISTRFTFGMSANIVKASLDSVDDLVSYFTGVKTPNKISDTVWQGGQKIATKTMDGLQKIVKDWGSR